MKSLTLPVKTPTTLKAINCNVRKVADIHEMLVAKLKNLVAVQTNIESLRQKAYFEGVPGSYEAFNTPIFILEDELNFLIQVAEGTKTLLNDLKAVPVERW